MTKHSFIQRPNHGSATTSLDLAMLISLRDAIDQMVRQAVKATASQDGDRASLPVDVIYARAQVSLASASRSRRRDGILCDAGL